MVYKNKITTAVFPVAGLGTRFLPVTKTGPKEMLPIVDKPLIQYVVEEALAVGIKQLVFITSSGKRAIEEYFDRNIGLENWLESRGKYDVLSTVKNIIPSDVNIVYVRQSQPLGLGHAVSCAKSVIKGQAFAVLLADDIMQLAQGACLARMLEVYQQTNSSVLAIESIPQQDTDKYGIIRCANEKSGIVQVDAIVEKPKPDVAPSNWAVTGRYILTPRIFELLEQTQRGVGNEIQLTDAIAQLLKYESVFACPVQGRRYDCGSRMGFLEATLSFALQRADLKQRLQALLNEMVNEQETV